MVALNTIANVNKSKGMSSFGVVRALKKLFNIKKVGHLGTLDPLATGVLPVFLGKATKLIPLFNGLDKEYRATFKLGQRTDTFDAEGKVIDESETTHLTYEQIVQCISNYKGMLQQLTPVFSAVKYNGIPSYRLARQGNPVVRKERTVQIEFIEVETIELPHVVMRIKCSKGTYIRSLVDDIGNELKVGAHLVELERLAVGPYFSLDNAYRLEDFSASHQYGDSAFCINPVDILKELQTLHVNEEEQKRLSHGQSVTLKKDPFFSMLSEKNLNCLIKAIDAQKTLIAIGHIIAHKDCYQFNPSKIFV